MSNYTSENLIPAGGVLPGTLAFKVGNDIMVGSFAPSTSMGKPIQPLTATSGTVTVPADESKVYTFTPAASDVIALTQPAAGTTITVELWINMPGTTVSFSFPSSVLWNSQDTFNSSNSAPDCSTASTLYAVIFRYDGSDWLGNLLYTKTLSV